MESKMVLEFDVNTDHGHHMEQAAHPGDLNNINKPDKINL